MTKNFAKGFIDHRDVGTRAQAVTKLALHHRERRLHVRPFVIALQKLVTLPHEEVKHVPPHLTLSRFSAFRAVRFERDERHSVFKHLESSDMSSWLDDYGLGELWVDL